MFDDILCKIDTTEKYLKVIQALTQGLWQAIINMRSGSGVPSAEYLYMLLCEVLKNSRFENFPLPEIEQWWAEEILRAYDEVRG